MGWYAKTRAERKEFLKQNQIDSPNVGARVTNVVEDETIHAPFPETLAFNARTGSIKWNFPDTVKK
jgi:hypothetical protein